MKKNILYFTLCIMLLSFTLPLSAQRDLTVSGTVYDENNESMPGVTVYLKDRAGIGTATDINGNFTIKAAQNDVVAFSFVGYTTREYLVTKDETGLLIQMEASATEMEEVVVEALGTTQPRITSVGVVSSINSKELQVPATSLANILGGRMAGVITMQSSGEPGQNISEFWVRGIGTFGANASALVLIDGLEGDLNSIDPADIESFSVLKDASAFSMTGTAAVHALSFIFSEVWHIPHGIACAFTLEDVFRINMRDPKTKQKLFKVVEALYGEGDKDSLIENLLDRIVALKRKFALPFTFKDLKIELKEDEIGELFNKSLDDPKMKNNSIEIDEKIIFDLIRNKL